MRGSVTDGREPRLEEKEMRRKPLLRLRPDQNRVGADEMRGAGDASGRNGVG